MRKTLRKFLTGNAQKAPAARPWSAAPTKRAIWRISESAPMGEWVDPDALPAPSPAAKPPRADNSASGWIESSMDLLNGADVSEDHDTSPDQLFDDVNARQRGPKRS